MPQHCRIRRSNAAGVVLMLVRNRCFPGLELPERVTAMHLFLIDCRTWDVAFPLELEADLPVKRLLVGFDSQTHVDPCSKHH